jgi:cephalosporin hydroxylase
MRHLTKLAELSIRWALGRSDSALPPWLMDSIQGGTLTYDYKGIMTAKNPFDLALYDLLISRLRPRTVIEIGTGNGGSSIWIADHLSIHGIDGIVHSMDIVKRTPPAHPRVELHLGDARKIEAVFSDDWLDRQARPLLVIDDGDHSYTSVLKILDYFGPRMTTGEYVIVEDGSADDLGLSHKLDGGPLRAIREYLSRSTALFAMDRSYCDFYGRNVTGNANGYLRRI